MHRQSGATRRLTPAAATTPLQTCYVLLRRNRGSLVFYKGGPIFTSLGSPLFF